MRKRVLNGYYIVGAGGRRPRGFRCSSPPATRALATRSPAAVACRRAVRRPLALPPPTNVTRAHPPPHLMLQGYTLLPVLCYRGIPSFRSYATRGIPPFPSNITRDGRLTHAADGTWPGPAARHTCCRACRVILLKRGTTHPVWLCQGGWSRPFQLDQGGRTRPF